MDTPAALFRGLLAMVLVASAILLRGEEKRPAPQPPVVYRAPAPTKEPLHTRWFKVDFNSLRREITNALQITGQMKEEWKRRSNLVEAFPKTTEAEVLFTQLVQYLKQLGADLTPPKSIFYSDTGGRLMVRGTLKDLDIVEQAVQSASLTPVQIALEVRWAEFDAEKSEQVFNSLGLADYSTGSFVNMPPTSGLVTSPQNKIYSGSNPPLTWMRVLTRNQCNAMFRKLDGSPAVNVITGPRLLTLNGNTAHAQVAVQSRSSLDIMSHVMADGYTLRLNAIQTVNELAGYDLNGKRDYWDYVKSPGTNPEPRRQYSQNPLAQQLPEPIYRLRQENAQAILWDGQTLVFWGSRQTPHELKNRVPLLGDLPIVGTFYRKLPEKKIETLIFITPTIVDESGNRVHKPEDMTFSENAVPLQKLN